MKTVAIMSQGREFRYQEYEMIVANAPPTGTVTNEDGKEVSVADPPEFYFFFDTIAWSAAEAEMNIMQTLFICLVLGTGAYMFASDANNLVLHPVERMVTKLNKIRRNPRPALHATRSHYSLWIFRVLKLLHFP